MLQFERPRLACQPCSVLEHPAQRHCPNSLGKRKRLAAGALIGHTGSQAGFLAFLYLNPVNGKAVVAAFNTANERPSGTTQSAVRIVREAALKLIE